MRTKLLNLSRKLFTACMIFSLFSQTNQASILFFGEYPYPNATDYEN